MRHLKFIIVFAALLFAACGGGEEPQTPPEVYLNLGNSLEWNENSKFLIIKTSGTWTIALNYLGEQKNWCTLSTTSGTGDRNVAISTTTNNSSSSRSVEITVQTESKTVSVTLEQKGNAELQVYLNDDNFLDWNETSKFLIIQTSETWTIALNYLEEQKNWCTLSATSGTGDRNVAISTTTNNSSSNRSVEITVQTESKTVSVTLEQKGNTEEPPPAGDISANINGLSEPISLAWNENTFTLNIICESSVAWDIATGGATWFSGVGNLYGNGTRSIVFNISQNAIRDNRDATLTIASSTGVVNLNFTQRGRRFEMPKIEEPQWFREYYGEISLEYGIAQKHAKWVAWPLHSGYLGSGRNDSWKFDNTLNPYNPVYSSSGPSDYHNQINLLNPTTTTRYDRGHLCPNADRNATDALSAATFWYSNASPQLSGFNGGIWARLEDIVRDKWAKILNDTLYICAGGSVLRDDHVAFWTTPSQMAMPKYYFKVILRKRGNNTYNAIGFWFEHKEYAINSIAANLDDVLMSVEEIEALTGINFFSDLPIEIQDVVEAQKNKNDWTW